MKYESEIRHSKKPARNEREIRKDLVYDNPRNYSQPDPMNVNLQTRSMTITIMNWHTEFGICRRMGQYFLELESSGKSNLINKGSIMRLVL